MELSVAPQPKRTYSGLEPSRQALNLVTMLAGCLSKGWPFTTVARQLDAWVQGVTNEQLELVARTILSFESFDQVIREDEQRVDGRKVPKLYPNAVQSLLAVRAAIGRGSSQEAADTTAYYLRAHFAAVARTMKKGEVGPVGRVRQRSMADQAVEEITAMSGSVPS